jgi:hypothetical protein
MPRISHRTPKLFLQGNNAPSLVKGSRPIPDPRVSTLQMMKRLRVLVEPGTLVGWVVSILAVAVDNQSILTLIASP